MGTLIGLIVLVCIFVLPSIITDVKFRHNTPPSGYETDYSAMKHDLIMGKSTTEVMKKCNNGGYYVRKK